MGNPTDKSAKKSFLLRLLTSPVGISSLCLLFLALMIMVAYEKRYARLAYPQVFIDNLAFGGKTEEEIKSYWLNENNLFKDLRFELKFDNQIATLSAEDLNLGYDATLSAAQALSVGRSKHWLSNFYQKFIRGRIDLTPYFTWNESALDLKLEEMAQIIDIPVQDALFQFRSGRVTAFRPSKTGRRLNRVEAKMQFNNVLPTIKYNHPSLITFSLKADLIEPTFTTNNVNSFGIKELIGRGYSEFSGSIPGRIHNVALAASRLNGVLIAPGEKFSFNQTVGDISAATGYQSAYIIKEGRTVLGDGGGVCQVSTTLFRAALASGLPITERHAHAYRVHYYEDAGEKPGLDATVYNPSYDLTFINDTPAYILIQTKTDTQKLNLTFEFYGTADGRKAEIFNQQLWGVVPPPAPLYQDDPTLRAGVVKQVDFAAWGANASFQYRVTRNGQTLQDIKFVSNYRPWQAVYLRGTQ